MIGGCCLAGEEISSRRHVEAGVFSQPIVENDDAQRIEKLPLVFVDALDLTVENGVRVDALAGRRSQPIGEARLGLTRGIAKHVAKSFVVGKRLELGQLTEVRYPAVADAFCDGSGQRRVRQQQPSSQRYPIRLVVETLGKHFGQILDRRGPQQPRVNRGDPVRAVRADDRQVRHPNLVFRTLLDQTEAGNALLVARIASPGIVEKAPIDFENDLQMSRQQLLKVVERPSFESLGQQRVVGVGQSPSCQIPGLVPTEARIIEQDPHQLRYRQCRVRIVELDRDLVR